jgi:hypothetical protein
MFTMMKTSFILTPKAFSVIILLVPCFGQKQAKICLFFFFSRVFLEEEFFFKIANIIRRFIAKENKNFSLFRNQTSWKKKSKISFKKEKRKMKKISREKFSIHSKKIILFL